MTLRIPAKVLLHVWSYDFYDMTLSTGKQRRHMIIMIMNFIFLYQNILFLYKRASFCINSEKKITMRNDRTLNYITPESLLCQSVSVYISMSQRFLGDTGNLVRDQKYRPVMQSCKLNDKNTLFDVYLSLNRNYTSRQKKTGTFFAFLFCLLKS